MEKVEKLENIKRQISFIQNKPKELPKIEGFELEPHKDISVQDVLDADVIKLNEFKPLVKNGKFNKDAFFEMVKDVPYTLESKEKHLVRDGHVYANTFQCIEVAYENGITLLHQYLYLDAEFDLRLSCEAKQRMKEVLANESELGEKVIIATKENETLVCNFKKDGRIEQLSDTKKNTARFGANEKLDILDYKGVVMYYSPRQEGEGAFIHIVDNRNNGVVQTYKEDGSIERYKNEETEKEIEFHENGRKVYRHIHDMVMLRKDDTLEKTWNDEQGICTVYEADGKTIAYTYDRDHKKTYPNSKKQIYKGQIGIVITGKDIPWDWSDSKHFR